jgi:hypothetical protein
MKSMLHGFQLACAACLVAAIGCAMSGDQKDTPKKSGAPAAKAERPPATMAIPAGSEHYGRPGYAVYEKDGRLWVFRAGSAELEQYHTKGEPAKRVTLVGAGPDRRTMVGPDRETLHAYLASWEHGREGFAVFLVDGRLWTFRAGSASLNEYQTKGEPAKRVTLVGAGPGRRTMVGPDRETIQAYLEALKYGREGFAVIPVEGRLWVFREGSAALEEYRTKGEPAKRVTLVGAGPDRRTVVGPDRETLDAYLVPWKYGRKGFEVFLVDGRLWVFRTGSPSLLEYRTKGEPAKRVTLVGAGPDRCTVVGPDRETLDAYLAPWKYGREGFEVFLVDGRLWVFRAGSPALEQYRTKGEPAKRVTLVGAGPDRRTMVGPDRETLDAYLAPIKYGREGFAVFLVDGRLWVFREGSTSLEEYQTKGEPAKRVTLVGAGPDGRTMVGPDRETLDDYLLRIRQ